MATRQTLDVSDVILSRSLTPSISLSVTSLMGSRTNTIAQIYTQHTECRCSLAHGHAHAHSHTHTHARTRARTLYEMAQRIHCVSRSRALPFYAPAPSPSPGHLCTRTIARAAMHTRSRHRQGNEGQHLSMAVYPSGCTNGHIQICREETGGTVRVQSGQLQPPLRPLYLL